MIKRYLLSVAVSMAFVTMAAAPVTDAAAEQETAVTEQVTADDGQTMVEASDVNSAEINMVEESEIARKMTQAEKARNAAENDSWGGAITIIAMCIVIGALVVLSVLFYFFGKASSEFMAKKKREAHGVSRAEADDRHDIDSGETIAAIGMALAEHFDKSGHDMEDTILTIRRMKKAYSPWNSKIYNMREVPTLRRNVR